MGVASIEPILRHIRRLVGAENVGPQRDRELLRRFTGERDESAFTELVERHALLVQGVCQRVLGQVQDAEDAFQATFLVLARRGAAIRNAESLGSWLHGVAYRVARKTRAAAVVRNQHERRAVPPVSAADADEISWREVRRVLDDELQRLPAKYREPLLQCYLQGKTQDEAAQELGWSPGTFRGRLDRGRERLRRRLLQRGITLSTALSATLLAQSVGRAAAPAALRLATVKAAIGFADESAAVGDISPKVIAMTEAMLKAMRWAKWQLAAWLSLVVIAAGVGGLAYQAQTENAPAGDAEPGQAETPQTRTDLYGDPLPEGALVRLGTVRFRPGVGGAIRFLPGGKTLVVGSWDALSLMDQESGKERTIRLSRPDERVLSLTYTADCQMVAGHLMNKTGPKRDRSTVRIWTVATGQLLRTLEYADPNNYTSRLVFSPDGKVLAAVGNNPAIRLLDATTGNELWKVEAPDDRNGSRQRRVAFSPDSRVLAGPGDKDPTICLWDAATGKKIREICRCTNVESVAFSADGTILVATTCLGPQEKQTRVRLWEVATGQELPCPEEQPGRACEAVISPDGTTLAATYATTRQQNFWGPCDVGLWEVATGKKLRQFQGGWTVAFSPDSKTLVSNYGMVYVHDVATGQERHQEFVGPQSSLWSVAFAPDGKTVITEDRHRIKRVWDTASAKQLGQMAGRPTRFNHWTYSPDGTLLAWTDVAFDGTIHLCDAASEQQVRLIKVDPKRIGILSACAFSPDGKVLVGAGSLSVVGGRKSAVWQWEVATGKELPIAHAPPGNGCNCIGFSPDGRLLALGCRDHTVRLWDRATGKEVRVLGEAPARPPEYGVMALAFSGDGKTLASGLDDGTLHLWEVASGKERRMLSEWAGCFSFSPDGLSLVAGSGMSALVWDVTGARQPGRRMGARGSAADPASLWADLAGDDAPKAYLAIGLLSTAPDGVAYLKERLRPVAFDERRVARWIADLGSDRFAVREQASHELEQVGELAEPALREVLTLKPGLEVRQRVEQLLERLERGFLSGERLRAWRAVEVLEAIGTPEARQVLELLTRGTEAARLTREARASLQRLANRPAAGTIK